MSGRYSCVKAARHCHNDQVALCSMHPSHSGRRRTSHCPCRNATPVTACMRPSSARHRLSPRCRMCCPEVCSTCCHHMTPGSPHKSPTGESTCRPPRKTAASSGCTLERNTCYPSIRSNRCRANCANLLGKQRVYTSPAAPTTLGQRRYTDPTPSRCHCKSCHRRRAHLRWGRSQMMCQCTHGL